MLVKGMDKSKSYNFCFKQLTMNFIYIGSLASSVSVLLRIYYASSTVGSTIYECITSHRTYLLNTFLEVKVSSSK